MSPPTVIAVVGASGGLGTSTLALAVGRRLAATGPPSLVVDLDLDGGGLDVTAGVEHLPGRRWPALTDVRGRVDAGLLLASLPEEDGCRLLSAGGPAAGPVPHRAVDDVLASLVASPSRTVVDCARGLPPPGVLRVSPIVLLVMSLGTRGLADGDARLEALLGLAGASGRPPDVWLVTRSPGRAGREVLDDVVAHLGVQHLWGDPVTAALALVLLGVLVWPRRDPGLEPDGRSGVDRSPAWRDRVDHLRRRRPGRGDDAWVADLADVVVVGLDAGLDLGRAVLTAARSPTVAQRVPWLEDEVSEAVSAGEPVADRIAHVVARAGAAGSGPVVRAAERTELDVLVRAWRLSEEVGAAASATTAAAASAMRGRATDGERARVLAAGPRASMWLLTALPLAGPLVGMVVGVGPGRLYASTPARVVALVGLVLTLGGWAWARGVLRRASRPATTVTGTR